MTDKEITLLKAQREKLSGKTFDLEGWKSQTLLLAQRIFGKEHLVLRMLNDLKYDYSSWHLRDVTGNKETEDPVRIQARQILDAAMAEPETLEVPCGEKQAREICDILEEELTGKQVKELQDILSVGGEGCLEKIKEKLNALKKEDLILIISRMMIG
ncbi:MAG: hypothetical protein PHZ25_04080 [Candidatus Pacebacteria bacterium]|nr:hypothetical protein [Candidatus Paceibacterota bacterium]